MKQKGQLPLPTFLSSFLISVPSSLTQHSESISIIKYKVKIYDGEELIEVRMFL